jgi:hypothetical protein
MCPACLSTLVLIAAGAGSAGGLTAFVAKKLHGGKQEEPREPDERRELPDTKEKAR